MRRSGNDDASQQLTAPTFQQITAEKFKLVVHRFELPKGKQVAEIEQ